MIGDSHAGALWDAAINSGNKDFNQAVLFGMGYCPPAMGAKFGLNTDHIEGCEKVILAAIKLIEDNPSIDVVTMSTYHKFIEESSYDVRERIFQGYKNTIQRILLLKRKVVFVIDHPSLESSPKTCEKNPIEIRNIFVKTPAFCSGATQDQLKPRIKYDEFVRRLRREEPYVIFLDSKSSFCPNYVCEVFENSEALYTDSHHLSRRGGNRILKILIDVLESSNLH